MSNLKVAKDAIKAELEHARQGVAHYQAKIASLEEALDKIDRLETAAGGKTDTSSNEDAPKLRRGRKARAEAAGAKSAGKLPATGKDFWVGLLGATPMSASEIYRAAVQSLGISPSKDEAKKLAQRQGNALSVLSKDGVIASTGSARSRQYFKQP